MIGRHGFENDDDRRGPLKYTVKKERDNDWSIKRNSQSADATGAADLAQQGYPSEDDAMQVLWDLKERNIRRIQATSDKLSRETREQDALLSGIGTWTPPPIEDPGP